MSTLSGATARPLVRANSLVIITLPPARSAVDRQPSANRPPVRLFSVNRGAARCKYEFVKKQTWNTRVLRAHHGRDDGRKARGQTLMRAEGSRMRARP
jgi:hypothetical protein